MTSSIILGLLIPFIGTTLGASLVFLLKEQLSGRIQKSLIGFAAGVMVAATFFSLILPSLQQSSDLGIYSFFPCSMGFLLGILFLLFLDEIVPHMHLDEQSEGPTLPIKKTTKLILAVTIHNIPEGMAIGVIYAAYLKNAGIQLQSAFALSLGIAIQNFPEGAIVSMPLLAEGMNKPKTFFYGMLSGAVEPLAALITIVFASFVTPILPYLLSFAAGAMIYVCIEELIPEMSIGKHSNIGTIFFSLGFVVMMILDTIFG